MLSPTARLSSLLCLELVASGCFVQRRPEATPTPARTDEGRPLEQSGAFGLNQRQTL